MRYKYVALNPEQKTLSGTIQAKNEQDAHDQLNKLSLSILSLQQISDEAAAEEKVNRYNFEARDKSGKKVVGTIAAETKLDALKRLSQEYELNVIALFPPTATKAEQESSFAEVKQLYQQIGQLEITQEQNKQNSVNPQQKERLKQVRIKAEQIIKQIDTFLNKFNQQLKNEEREYLKNELIHLQKIKHTENVENLERSCKKVLTYIQEKELFIEDSKNIQEKTNIQLQTQQLLGELKGIERKNLNRSLSKTPHLKSQLNWWQQLKAAIFDNSPNPEQSPPEITALQNKIKAARQEIWNYIKLIIYTKKKKYRSHAIKALRPLLRKWWRLHQELKTTEDKIEGAASQRTTFFEQNIPLFVSGWLLAFYMVIYFIFLFLTIKDFTFVWPDFFHIHYTSILMYTIIAVFLAHIAIKTKLWLMKKHFPLANLSYFVAVLSFLLVWINL